jgi:hypothetical protein
MAPYIAGIDCGFGLIAGAEIGWVRLPMDVQPESTASAAELKNRRREIMMFDPWMLIGRKLPRWMAVPFRQISSTVVA